jgi:hypothetical protein
MCVYFEYTVFVHSTCITVQITGYYFFGGEFGKLRTIDRFLRVPVCVWISFSSVFLVVLKTLM